MRFHLLLRFIAVLPLASQSYLLTTIAGNQSRCGPGAMTVDPAGVTYLVTCQRVLRVFRDGRVDVIAGRGGSTKPDGDGGPAIDATMMPSDIAADGLGNIYIAEFLEPRVRRITPGGRIETVADFESRVIAIAAAPDGTLYVGVGNSIRKRLPDGSFTRIDLEAPVVDMGVDRQGNLYASSAPFGRVLRFRPDGTPGLLDVRLKDPYQFAVDGPGNLYFIEQTQPNDRSIVRLDPQGNRFVIRPQYYFDHPFLAGVYNGEIQYHSGGHLIFHTVDGFVGSISVRDSGDGGLVNTASYFARDIVTDTAGNIFLADPSVKGIRKIDARGFITTVASGIEAFGGFAIDTAGNFYVSDQATHSIFRISAAGNRQRIAGRGATGFSGDGGPATLAVLNTPSAIAIDPAGNLYFIDSATLIDGEHTIIRHISPAGIISSVHQFELGEHPQFIAVDKAGSLYFPSRAKTQILRRAPDGRISVFADLSFFAGNFTVDRNGVVYVSSAYGTCNIWKIAPESSPVIIAGSDRCGFANDYGLATQAQLYRPLSLSVDPQGNILFIDDFYIRKLEPANLFPRSIVNAASFQHGPVAPGELLTIYWTGVSPDNTKVFVDDIPAPILFVSGRQANVMVPFEIAGRKAVALRAESAAGRTNTVFLQAAPAEPGLFPPILNRDGSLNRPANPARRGETITLYATGCGQLAPAGRTGAIATGTRKTTALPVSAFLDRGVVDVTYAGTAPGLIEGICQINLRLPEYVEFNQFGQLSISIAGTRSNTVFLSTASF